MSEKMRSQFEAEYLASMNSRYLSDESEKLVYLKRDKNGDYVHDLTYSAFNWWCKSRAALVVELPSLENGLIHPFDGPSMIVDAVAKQLDAAGVSYK